MPSVIQVIETRCLIKGSHTYTIINLNLHQAEPAANQRELAQVTKDHRTLEEILKVHQLLDPEEAAVCLDKVHGAYTPGVYEIKVNTIDLHLDNLSA